MMTSDELRHIAKALLTYADEMDGHVLDFSDIHQAILITGVHGTSRVNAGGWEDISRIATLDIAFDIDPNYINAWTMRPQEKHKITKGSNKKHSDMLDYSCEILNSISVKDMYLVESVDLRSTPDYFSVTAYFKEGVDDNESR